MEFTERERILSDDYSVYPTYYYLGDGKLIESPIKGTVADLKRLKKENK